MDFEQLLSDSLRFTLEMAAKDVGTDPVLIEDLFRLSMAQENPPALRASRVLDICCETNPDLAVPYLNRFVEALPTLYNDSVKRNFLHILGRSHQPITEKNWTLLLNCTLGWLVSPQEKPAVRAYCMDILYHLAMEEPELKSEICYALDTACIESSAAVTGRSKRFLKALKKLH